MAHRSLTPDPRPASRSLGSLSQPQPCSAGSGLFSGLKARAPGAAQQCCLGCSRAPCHAQPRPWPWPRPQDQPAVLLLPVAPPCLVARGSPGPCLCPGGKPITVLGHRALSVLPFLPDSHEWEELMLCHAPCRHQPERMLSSGPGGRPVSPLGLRNGGSRPGTPGQHGGWQPRLACRWPQARTPWLWFEPGKRMEGCPSLPCPDSGRWPCLTR